MQSVNNRDIDDNQVHIISTKSNFLTLRANFAHGLTCIAHPTGFRIVSPPCYYHSACDRLRCTDCNFEVLCFEGRAWDANIDYMFLRNNAPDPAKLSARLTRSSGN